MSCLPFHGRVKCTRCFEINQEIEFDKSKLLSADRDWRITSNPLAWGNINPEVVVLGFSKGPTQAGALTNTSHDKIAYKGSRTAVGKILSHIDLIECPANGDFAAEIDNLIADKNGRFHFGSLIRCTVERHDVKVNSWKGSGGGMLDKFVASPFGNRVATNCASQFLVNLPLRTKLVIMFGLGTKLNYVASSRALLERVRQRKMKQLNDIAYSDGDLTFVHVEHFASQGALIPNWLGVNNHPRSQYGVFAREAVRASGASTVS